MLQKLLEDKDPKDKFKTFFTNSSNPKIKSICLNLIECLVYAKI